MESIGVPAYGYVAIGIGLEDDQCMVCIGMLRLTIHRQKAITDSIALLLKEANPMISGRSALVRDLFLNLNPPLPGCPSHPHPHLRIPSP